MLVKVCGLMNKEDVNLCIKMGVKRLGFVTEFPVSVPWNINRALAKELIEMVPEGIDKVVVTAGDSEKIIEIARCTGANLIQTGFGNGIEETTKLINSLKEIGVGVIGKYPTSKSEQEEIFGSDSIEDIVKIICNTGVTEILIDPRNKDNAASKKLTADTELVRRVKVLSTVPVILAGGITHENIAEKLKESGADSADVMNGSENEPGKKSREKIMKLLENTNNM